MNFAVLEVVKEFHVVRYFRFIKHKDKNTCYEFMQTWLSEQGYSVRSKQRCMGRYFDTFFTDSEMRTRKNNRNYSYNRLSDIPYCKLFIRSRKAQRAICSWSNKQYFLIGRHNVWLTDEIDAAQHPILETIMKQDYIVAEQLLLNRVRNFDAVKVAWKHGYLTRSLDYKTWYDAVCMAGKLHLDTHNPFYICPKNLQTDHNLYCNRLLRKQEAERRRERELQQMKDKQANIYYKEFIKKFLNILFTDGTITIQPLKSVEEFKQEGEMMHHCVFGCGYYKKADTLILSAQVNGKHVETIEVNLKRYEVVQSRGVNNQPSIYHEEIKALMKSGMKEIRNINNKQFKAA